MNEPTSRPSRKELLGLLHSVEPKTFSILCRSLGISTVDEYAPLPTVAVLQIAAYDWMTSTDVLSSDNKLILLLSTPDRFESVARLFEQEEADGRYTPRILAINDYRYAVFGPVPQDRLQGSLNMFFDVKEEQWLPVMPQQALTTVACDLNVLLLRLFARMEAFRQHQREGKDAATSDAVVRGGQQAAAEGGPGPREGP